MEPSETYQKIIDYVHGIMDNNERAVFEKKISQDPELAKAVQFEQSINKALKEEKQVGDLKSTLKRIGQKRKHRKRIIGYIWATVIGVLILALVYLLNIWPFDRNSPDPFEEKEQIFAMLAEKSGNSTYQFLVGRIDSLLMDNDPENYTMAYEALDSLQKIILMQDQISEGTLSEVLFNKAIIMRRLNNRDQAISLFNTLISTESEHNRGIDAKWELAVTYWQLKEFEKCKSTLENLLRFLETNPSKQRNKTKRKVKVALRKVNEVI